jgi:hypothetical protein
MPGETTHVMGAATSGSFEGVRTAAVDAPRQPFSARSFACLLRVDNEEMC